MSQNMKILIILQPTIVRWEYAKTFSLGLLFVLNFMPNSSTLSDACVLILVKGNPLKITAHRNFNLNSKN